ncbi:hypothetical protein BGX28_003874 [Mortierella sp. GBA30]|nr:hypothetical protein BGX28_003874 [Mortierella sp. GBA30]
MAGLDEARLKDAVKFMQEADKSTEKSWFKKPDWDIAGQYYEKAAQSFKSAKSYEQSVQAFIKASDAMVTATSLFMAGRALENGGNVCLQNLGQPERAAEMYKRASELFMQNMTPDRAAEMLEKSAKAMEPISVDAAMDLYIGACNIYEGEDRAKYATDTYKRTIALLVKHKRFEKAIEILLRLGNVQKDTANKSAYFKTLLSIIIVQLAAGDEVEAGKKFQEFCIVEGFVRTEESAVAHAMLDAFEHRDQNYYNQVASRQHVGFLDNEIARLARNIVISNDLISGGGYVDPSGGPNFNSQQGGVPFGNDGYPQQQHQQQQQQQPYSSQAPSGHNPNQFYHQQQPPQRQPSPYQQPGTSSGYSISPAVGGSSPAPAQRLNERNESDWRALTQAPNQQQQQQGQQHHQQQQSRQQAGGPPNRNYYEHDDDGLLYEPGELRPDQLQGIIQVDFKSLLLGYTANTLSRKKLDSRKKPFHKQQNIRSIIKDLVHLLISKFPPFLTRRNCKIHFDGSHTEEKALARIERLEQYQVQNCELLATADLELEKITTVLDRVKSPAPQTCSQRSFVVKHAAKAIDSGC